MTNILGNGNFRIQQGKNSNKMSRLRNFSFPSSSIQEEGNAYNNNNKTDDFRA